MVKIAYEKKVKNDMYIFLQEWLEDADKLYALYRSDWYPSDFRDRDAGRSVITKTVFEEQKAIILPSLDRNAAIYYIRFFSEKDGKIKNEGQYSLENFSKQKIFYRINKKKVGLFKKQVEIVFHGETEEFQLPEVEVYQADGFAPAFKNVGRLVMKVPRTEVKGSHCVLCPDSVKKGNGISIFLKDNELYQSYAFRAEGSNIVD